MCGIKCLIARNGPIKLMRKTSCQCSTVWSASGTSPPLTPALAQIASSLPYLDTALSTNSCTSFSDPASACIASTVPPASLTSLAVSFTLSLRSTAISRAPSFVNNNEAARPMPLPAPVMMTDLPSRRPMLFSPLKFYCPMFPANNYQFALENPHKKHACRLAEFQTRFQTPKLFEFAHLKPIWLRSKLPWIKSLADKLLEETRALT